MLCLVHRRFASLGSTHGAHIDCMNKIDLRKEPHQPVATFSPAYWCRARSLDSALASTFLNLALDSFQTT